MFMKTYFKLIKKCSICAAKFQQNVIEGVLYIREMEMHRRKVSLILIKAKRKLHLFVF